MATNTFNTSSTAITTTIGDIYTTPGVSGNKAVVLSVLVANVNGSASADLTLTKTTSANTTQTQICWTIPVPALTTLECVPNKIVLNAGEKLRALASANSYLQATVSVLEIT